MRVSLMPVLMLIILLSAQAALADLTTEWSYFYGAEDNEEVFSIVLKDNGNFLTAGLTESYGFGEFGKPDIYLVELDEYGTVVWEETYGVADSFETAYHMLKTEDSGYLMAGYKCTQWGFGGGDGILLKVDSLGNEEWFKQYDESDNDSFRFVSPSPAGGYILCGATRIGAGFVDAWVMKVDSLGNTEWDFPYGGTEYDVAKTVYPLDDGGYLVTGYTNSQGAGDRDAWVFKIDASGVMEWEKVYGGVGYDVVYHSAPTTDGNFVITGMVEDGSDACLWVFKIDPSGNLIWEKAYDKASGDDEGHYIEETSDNGFVIAAWAGYQGSPWTEMWIVRLDDMGEMLWDSAYGGAASDCANVVRQLNSTDYLLGGSTLSFGGGRVDMWLMKLHDNQTGIESDPFAGNSLFRCYPNPCISSAVFFLDVPVAGDVSVDIYDHTGRQVLAVHQGVLQSGMHTIPFNGAGLSNGLYYARMRAGNLVLHEKVVLLR